MERKTSRTVNKLASLPLAALTALALGSCTPFSPQNPPPGSSAQVPPPQSRPHRLNVPPDQIDRAINEAKLSCESGTCPPGVAMLLIRDENSHLSQCTGFLLNTQTLMTNSHCLEKNLRTKGSACSGITAVFAPAAAGGAEERIACESVEFASAISGEGAAKVTIDLLNRNHPRLDVAILRLSAPSARAPLALDRQGFGENETLQAWAVDPISDVIPGGVLRRKICQPVRESVLAPDFNSTPASRATAVAAFRGCEILHGNSGSPALDSAGHVRAVVFATLPSRELDHRHFQAMSLMSNLACVPDAGAALPQECGRTPREGPQLNREAAERIAAQVERWLQAEGAPLGRAFGFDLSASEVALSSNEAMIHLLWSEPHCTRTAAPALTAKAAPVWQVRFDVNEFYQPQVRLLMAGQFTFELTANPEGTGSLRRKLESSTFAKSLSDRGRNFETPQNLALPRCE